MKTKQFIPKTVLREYNIENILLTGKIINAFKTFVYRSLQNGSFLNIFSLSYFSVVHGSGHSNLDLEFLPILKQMTFKKNKA